MNDLQTGKVEVTFPSQTEFVHMITVLASNAATVAGFDKKQAGKVAIATDEAVTNVIRHAYGGRSDKIINFTVEITPKSLILKVSHTGKALKKNEIRLPVMEEYIKKKQPGGLGLFIIDKFMDEVDYLAGEEHCCLMTKYRNMDQSGAEKK
ncbi:ATP-binding protein [Sulfidibacter corallicola]|uniref:ATP-binding protein n=1 Tax=Sulfidibacter corallicola TaxID=2818388 RepID=A0A8A4TVA1_SULCO|nr:ATP-binding protein [Sulfidibacter corallicola]QTD53287.1 ATP-binding protein [Sulfidibacter corallicola]